MADNFHVDAELVRRWAGWLMVHYPHVGGKVLNANNAKAQSLVTAANIAWRSITDATAMEQEFSREELLHLAALSHAEMGTLVWSEGAARQRKRQEALNLKAQEFGFETWTRFETAVINEDVEVVVKRL